MYFLAIDTTSRRLAAGQLLAGVAPDLDQLALPVAQLRVERDLRVVAHPLEQLGVVAGDDPALQGRERHALAGPVVEGPQADVVARVEVPVVDREVGEVEQHQECIRASVTGCRPRRDGAPPAGAPGPVRLRHPWQP